MYKFCDIQFGLPVFLRFGLMVNNSAFRFSYNSAFRIRPNGPVCLKFLQKNQKKTKNQQNCSLYKTKLKPENQGIFIKPN